MTTRHPRLLLVLARQSLGWTQRELAQNIGSSQRTVTRWEGGSSDFDANNAVKLARHVYPVDPGLAAELAAAAGQTLIGLGLEAPPPPPPPPPPPVALPPPPPAPRPAALRDLIEAVVCTVADSESVRSLAVADATVMDGGASVTASEIAAIQAYWSKNFYDDTDIQHSFDTALGDHVDCIPFAAQHSVRARLAHGLEMAPPPPKGIVPTSATSANIPLAPGGNDGTLDANGNVRACPSGTVMKKRPTVGEIEASGGLAAYQNYQAHRPRPQNAQDVGEHDCWDNNQPLNFSSAPPANFCNTMNGGVGWHQYQGAGYCGNYDHAVGIQANDWLPYNARDREYATGYYGASLITPQILPTIDYNATYMPAEHSVSQFWMQTGTCENWWNGNNSAHTGQQCNIGHACTTSGNCAVQSIEMGAFASWQTSVNTMRLEGVVFYTPDGYYSGCYSNAADDSCPCYSSDGCSRSYCTEDSECNAYQICNVSLNECDTVQPYVAVTDPYYTPGSWVDPSSYGVAPSEMPIQVWNGTAQGLPYYYIFMYGQWIGWYTTAIFEWPYAEGVGDAGGAGGNGPMVAGPATYLQAGGEVFQQWPYEVATNKNYHSQTSMASDYPPADGFKYASYQRNVQYMDSTGVITYADGGYRGSGLHDATLSFLTSYTTPSIPLTNEDSNAGSPDGVPGLCGYPAGQIETENNVSMSYGTSTTPAAGGSGWGEYFYVGTVGLH